MLIKIGESLNIQSSDIQTYDNLMSDPDILTKFTKYAKELKALAPKADDFLYFSCIMMHAAEAALLNPDGSLKKDASGKEVTAHWEQKGESVKWVCSDNNIKALKNNNNDIFPEKELIAAHKKWVGKPLCLDHKSESVDMIRGLIIDTHYDYKNKRVIALCALDKKNYPDLARKVASGYAASVSMGTGVERAVCYDCGTVARTEKDFCGCMRARRSYGEINLGLNPIELSIVVNGADPNAKIRHIIAAADSMAKYIELKESELNKKSFSDNSKLKESLTNTINQLNELKEELSEVEQEKPAEENKEDASKEVSAQNWTESLQKIASKLDTLSEQLNRLYKITDEESNMTSHKKAYFQGGGDVNEPAPKQVKYPKEESDKVRDTEDKQMVGQMNMGPVDGMHPGYESFGESEEQRKKRLQRLAEAEAREMRRQAALKKAKEAVEKQAYFQGGGDVNEPTPGKPKYTKEDSDSIRDKEDKQMVGQPPFPSVGSVEGLHPSPASVDVKDELKRKQMLARAEKITAKFEKLVNADGTKNVKDSYWKVLADNNVVYTASVKEIAGKDSRAEILYDSIANKEFGRQLVAKVLSGDFSFAKTAQEAPAAPAAPVAAPPPPAMPAMPAMPEVEAPKEDVKDSGGNGDPKKEVMELLDTAENVLADLRQAVTALTGETDSELKAVEDMAAEGELAPSTASKVELGKTLRAKLKFGFKVASTEVEDLVKELSYAKDLYENKDVLSPSQVHYLNEVTAKSLEDGRVTLAESYKLMKSLVSYSKASSNIVKQATLENKNMRKSAQYAPADVGHDPTKPIVGKVYHKGDPFMPLGAVPGVPYTEEMLAKNYPHLVAEKTGGPGKPEAGSAYKAPAKPVAAPKPEEKKPEWRQLEQGPFQTAPLAGGASGMVREMRPDELAKDKGKVEDSGDLKMGPDGSLEGSPEEVGKAMKEVKAQFDLSTKEGRTAYRLKQAEKAMSISEMLGKAHKGGGLVLDLDMKPADNQGKVETLDEVHKVMVDVATAPVKVKKAAEKLDRYIKAGKIEEKDFPALIAQGLDKDAVAYWKKFLSQTDGGSEFASDFVKEYAEKKASDEQEAYRVKLARSYELANTMVQKGFISNEASEISKTAKELINYNDEAFASFQNWVSKTPSKVKTASAMPQVGIGTFEQSVMVPVTTNESDLVSDFSKMFSNKKY